MDSESEGSGIAVTSTYILVFYPPLYFPPCLYPSERVWSGWGNFGDLRSENLWKMVDFQREIGQKGCEKGKIFRACGGLTENTNKRV